MAVVSPKYLGLNAGNFGTIFGHPGLSVKMDFGPVIRATVG